MTYFRHGKTCFFFKNFVIKSNYLKAYFEKEEENSFKVTSQTYFRTSKEALNVYFPPQKTISNFDALIKGIEKRTYLKSVFKDKRKVEKLKDKSCRS